MKQESITLTVDAKEAAKDLSAVLSAPPLWRVQMVRVLQLIGIFGGFVGGADFLQLVAIMPPDVAAWLVIAGPAFAAGSKPLVMLIGDILDDGQKNDSFKLPLVAFFLCLGSLAVLALGSCANVPGLGFAITPDGCALATYTDAKTGQKFKSGACVGPDGKVAQYVTEWTNPEGVRIRATRPATGGATVFWYQDAAGGWVQWSSKAGLSLGATPTASLE